MPGSYLDRLDRLSPVLRKVSIEIVMGEFTQIGGKAVQPVQLVHRSPPPNECEMTSSPV